MKPLFITVRVRFAWWVKPYLWLTRFGVWLGLPINEDVVASDLKRGIRVEVIK